MNKFVTENLILLEFLVDEIYFTPPTKKKIDSVQGETNVMFQFLDNQPIYISSQELRTSADGQSRCGKSCLFSMSTEQGIEALGNFLIKLKIFQKFPPGVLPNVIDIACGDVCVSELFQDLMESAMGSAEKAWVKCQKDVVKMYMCGECVGSVSVFIRMSCYGKYIVTQCEMNMGDFQDKKKACAGGQKQAQSKCLPISEDMVKGAKDTSQKEKKPKRQLGSGAVMSEDPCREITRRTDAVCLENRMQGDFVGQVKARDMAFQMLDVPVAPPPSPRQAPLNNFYQMPNLPSYSPYPQPYSMPDALCVQSIRPCDPCPPTRAVGPDEKEITPRPPEKRIPQKKRSKDKLILRLAMPKYGPKDDCNKPYEFEFVTPAGWPREHMGRQCRDAQCDCRDFPKGYLEEYYGRHEIVQRLLLQMQEEMRREKVYGICPVGQFSKTKRPKGGIAELYYKCLGVSALMKGKKVAKPKAAKAKKKKGGGKGGGKKKGGKVEKLDASSDDDDDDDDDVKSKMGKAKKGGGKKKVKKPKKEKVEKDDDDEDDDKDEEEEKPKAKKSKIYFRPKRKLRSHGGIPVPDRRPICGPCEPREPCGGYGPCGICSMDAPCAKYGQNRRGFQPCMPYNAANQRPCATCPSVVCSQARSASMSSPSRCQNCL